MVQTMHTVDGPWQERGSPGLWDEVYAYGMDNRGESVEVTLEDLDEAVRCVQALNSVRRRKAYPVGQVQRRDNVVRFNMLTEQEWAEQEGTDGE